MTVEFISDVLQACSDALMLPAVWPFVGLALLCVVAEAVFDIIRFR